ncbi:uncharacterized protein At3g28850-like [Hordeum vulgare subsp. vulgare]|uniref:uncharacterized protein At3g28850-like n=1 Tax=Hordeum vulgare subsp. vulgare TaxID=112509 RepID=UPI001D1A3D53|nr:uncharacterized protein At3g28850-like [Hordeum vulgare subsp. vulgare]
MGCKGSKHALHGGGGGGALEPRKCASGLVARHSVALRSSTLGTLSLDRATAAAAPVKRQRLAPPRTPTKTPARDPEEINVWELMHGLDDDDDSAEEYDDCVDAQVPSACGSPEFDPDVLSAFREALVDLSPPHPDAAVATDGGAVVNKEEIQVFADVASDGGAVVNKEEIQKEEIQVFAGVVRARLDVLQGRIDSRSQKNPPPPPESRGRVVVYLTSLRGIRQTYEDCWAASTILSSYGVHVDERDLSMHAGYKDELRDAVGAGASVLPQVFVDGWHLGGAEEVRRMHESGELAEALDVCEAAPGASGGGKEGPGGFGTEPCGGCGGARFVPCDVCSGSCKVFVEDEGGAGAFRRCPDCNENGLLRCPIC